MTEPKYEKIASDIESKILSGFYEIDSPIPTERELQELYNVSRHTVREAISILVNNNLVEKRRGSGTFVSEHFFNHKSVSNNLTVGLITTRISEFIFPSIIRGVEEELNKNNVALILSSSNLSTKLEKMALEKMIKYGVDGLIIDPTKSNKVSENLAYYSTLDKMKIPYIMINAYHEELNAYSIRNDDVKAGFLATNHLIENGHKDIMIITKIDDMQGKKRLQGYIKAHQQYRLPYNNKNIITFETEDIISAEDFLSKIDYSTATSVVTYNDQLAGMLVKVLESKNLHVPSDISIVSHDDSLDGVLSDYPLTTVPHPKEKLGRDAADWIYQAITNPKKELSDIVYEPKLVVRNSVRNINVI